MNTKTIDTYKPKTKMEKLALEMLEYIQKKEMDHMVNIYVNNNRWCTDAYKNEDKPVCRTRYGEFYLIENVDVTTILEYCNPETVSVTFEGPLYHAMNYGEYDSKAEENLNAIAEKYGLYIECGYAWSFSLYK